jgi:hypothetical protein
MLPYLESIERAVGRLKLELYQPSPHEHALSRTGSSS